MRRSSSRETGRPKVTARAGRPMRCRTVARVAVGCAACRPRDRADALVRCASVAAIRSRRRPTATTPVVLVHGWGGSFQTTWRHSGFTELLADAGRTVIGVDLLGHGEAPKPHDPEAYADLTARIVDALPDEPVDASASRSGRSRCCGWPTRQPERFRRLVLAGHRPQRVRARRGAARKRILAGVEGTADPRRQRGPPVRPVRRPAGQRPPSRSPPCMKRPDEGPFTAERAGGRRVPGARRHRRPRLRRSRRRARRRRCPTPGWSCCATSTTSPRRSRSGSSTPRSSSSTPSLADGAAGHDRRRRRRRAAASPAASSPSRPRPCTGSAPTPTTPAPSPASSRSRAARAATR